MSSTDKTYRVNEIFCSLQGEGFHTGTAVVFLRFSGCNRACSFCDTDFAHYTEMTAAEIVSAVSAYVPRHIIITGGEPTLQLDSALVSALKAEGFYVQIETNGSNAVCDGVDWVTCSPKAEPWGIGKVDELKVVYQGQDVERLREHFCAPHNFLQPCSGKNTAEVVEYIKSHPQWRLSLQTHKLINIQ
jgi:organic radical activating enzyme